MMLIKAMSRFIINIPSIIGGLAFSHGC